MAIYFLPSIIFIFFLLLREIFTYKKNKLLKYLLTPLVSAVVIITALLSLRFNYGNTYNYIIITGLVFSLIGDTILMIEEVNLFIQGLIFFLFAQISYAFAFAFNYHFEVWNIFVAAGLFAVVIVFFKIIKNKAAGKAYPVLIYMLVISAMVYFAVSRLNDGASVKGLLVSIGALLFLISDVLVAVNEFVKELPNGTIIVWLIYAPSQFLIGLSCFFY